MALRPPPTADLSQGHETYSATTSSLSYGQSYEVPAKLNPCLTSKSSKCSKKVGRQRHRPLWCWKGCGAGGSLAPGGPRSPTGDRRKGGPCREAKPGQMVP